MTEDSDQRKLAISRRPLLFDLVGGGSLLGGMTGAWAAHAAQPSEPGGSNSGRGFRPDPTGSQAIEPALNEQLELSYRDFNRTIAIPNGRYRKVGETVIRQGVMIGGEGSQGSSYDSGTAFVQSGATGAFHWNGAGAAFQGTGGGLKNALIVKEAGSHGGTAIRLTATNDDHRPGEMMFENVLVYAKPGADWQHGLVIDGRACDTPGARGVRSIYLYKCRFVDATFEDASVVLDQVAHFYAFGLAIDPGHTGRSGMTLRGINDGVYFVNAGIGGNVVIVPADSHNQTRNFHFHGKIGGFFRNDDPGVNGSLIASFEEAGKFVLINRSPGLRCVTNINPDFLVTRSTPAPRVTGDGTTKTLVFEQVARDRGNNFGSGPSDRFTAYCAGSHIFSVRVALFGLSADHTFGELRLRQSGSRSRLVPLAFAPGNGGTRALTYSLSATFELAHGDTVSVELMVAGGARIVGVHGERDVEHTAFEGRYQG